MTLAFESECWVALANERRKISLFDSTKGKTVDQLKKVEAQLRTVHNRFGHPGEGRSELLLKSAGITSDVVLRMMQHEQHQHH